MILVSHVRSVQFMVGDGAFSWSHPSPLSEDEAAELNCRLISFM